MNLEVVSKEINTYRNAAVKNSRHFGKSHGRYSNVAAEATYKPENMHFIDNLNNKNYFVKQRIPVKVSKHGNELLSEIGLFGISEYYDSYDELMTDTQNYIIDLFEMLYCKSDNELSDALKRQKNNLLSYIDFVN